MIDLRIQFATRYLKMILLVSTMSTALSACGPMTAATGLNPQTNLSSIASPLRTREAYTQDGVPLMNSWEDSFPMPAYAPDCLSNPAYNMCLTYKDPVTTAGQLFSPDFTPGRASADQVSAVFTYGLWAPNANPENSLIQVDSGSFQTVAPGANGGWKYKYIGDSNHFHAQMNSWYAANREHTYLRDRTGVFWASEASLGSKITLRPFETSVANNALYKTGDNSVNIGYTTINRLQGSKGELALEQTVTIHEMGHADFFAASPTSVKKDFSVACGTNARCCPDPYGCINAIHEGQADFRAKILFPDQDGSQGRFMQNTWEGASFRNPDYILENGLTADQIFNDSKNPGEVHALGAAYDTIWYYVWRDAQNNGFEQSVEKIFMLHLAGLQDGDNFVSAFATIEAVTRQVDPEHADWILYDFRDVYAMLGLDLGPDYSGATAIGPIQALATNKCMNIPDNGLGSGVKVRQLDCNDSGNQQFVFWPIGDGSYQIQSAATGYCVEVTAGYPGNSIKIQQADCTDNDNQHFAPVASNGGYALVAKHSGRCVDLPGSNPANGVIFQQWDCNGGGPQTFGLPFNP